MLKFILKHKKVSKFYFICLFFLFSSTLHAQKSPLPELYPSLSPPRYNPYPCTFREEQRCEQSHPRRENPSLPTFENPFSRLVGLVSLPPSQYIFQPIREEFSKNSTPLVSPQSYFSSPSTSAFKPYENKKSFSSYQKLASVEQGVHLESCPPNREIPLPSSVLTDQSPSAALQPLSTGEKGASIRAEDLSSSTSMFPDNDITSDTLPADVMAAAETPLEEKLSREFIFVEDIIPSSSFISNVQINITFQNNPIFIDETPPLLKNTKTTSSNASSSKEKVHKQCPYSLQQVKEALQEPPPPGLENLSSFLKTRIFIPASTLNSKKGKKREPKKKKIVEILYKGYKNIDRKEIEYLQLYYNKKIAAQLFNSWSNEWELGIPCEGKDLDRISKQLIARGWNSRQICTIGQHFKFKINPTKNTQ